HTTRHLLSFPTRRSSDLFLAYWLSAKLERQWRQKEQTIEVHNLLRQLQTIRLGQLQVHGKPFKTMVAQVPKDLNAILNKLGLLRSEEHTSELQSPDHLVC